MIRDWLRDVWYGLQNLRFWLPVIWRDRDWDWCFLAAMMELKLDRMARCIAENGYHVGAARDARRMRTCAALLRRLAADDYHVNAGWEEAAPSGLPVKRRALSHSDAMSKQDQRFLGELIGRHLREWWD